MKAVTVYGIWKKFNLMLQISSMEDDTVYFLFVMLPSLHHHNRKENLKINRIHERALRLVYKDDTSSFAELLERDGSFTIHERNIQSLVIEMFKSKNNIGPILLQDILVVSEYNGPNLRSVKDFITTRIRSVHYGQDSLQYFGPIIWNLIPNEIRNVETLNTFKGLIRKWSPDKCPCRLCKTYVANVGYIL